MRKSVTIAMAALLVTWTTAGVGKAGPNPDAPPEGYPGNPMLLSHDLDTHDGVAYSFVAPDGNWAVFKAGFEGLFSVPTSGGEPVRLNPQMDENEYFFSVDISPDSRNVLFSSDHAASTHHLYAVPIAGGPLVRLSSGLPTYSEVDLYDISTDSQMVAFRADETSMRDMGLYSVPMTGGTPLRLYPDPPHLTYIWDLQITPDGSRVVFGADDLRSIPIAGGTATILDTFGWVDPEITSDSTYAFYTRYDDTGDVNQLFRVPVVGGTVEQISDGETVRFSLSADAGHVVWDEDGVLHTATVDGGTQVEIGLADSYVVTPDSLSIVYLTPPPGQEVRRVAIDGGPSHLIAEIPTGQLARELGVSDDSQRVIYLVEDTLIVAPVGGGAPTVQVEANGDIGGVMFSADSSRVVYTVRSSDGVHLFSVPARGGSVVELTNPAQLGDSMEYFTVTPDSRRVVFQANTEPGGHEAVWSVLIGWPCGPGFASLVGSPADDVISGTHGRDIIITFGGDDTVYAKRGADTVCAGGGADTVFGGWGADKIYGGLGADRIFGGVGYDLLWGGRGPDLIRGGDGNDTLRGQAGDDTLRGGPKTDACFGSTGTDIATGCEVVGGVP